MQKVHSTADSQLKAITGVNAYTIQASTNYETYNTILNNADKKTPHFRC